MSDPLDSGDNVPSRPAVTVRVLRVALAMGSFLLLGPDTDQWWIRVGIFCRGLSMGFCFVSSQAAASYAEIAEGQRSGVGAVHDAAADVDVDRHSPDGDGAAELPHAHRDAVRSAAGADRLPLDLRPLRRTGAVRCRPHRDHDSRTPPRHDAPEARPHQAGPGPRKVGEWRVLSTFR